MSLSALEPYGQDRVGRRRAEPDGEERWHVRLSSDDVKVMTVEQLDDAYRLSIVDSETAVWKPGMGQWQPLGVVAGLDEDSAVEVTAVGPSPHDATPRFTSAFGKVALPPPPVPPFRAVAAAPPPSVPASAQRFTPPPRLKVVSSPVPPETAAQREPSAPRYPASIATYPAAVASYVATAAPPSAAFTSPPSVPPLALSIPPAVERRTSGGFGRALLTIAFLAGTCVSLYRNDLLLTLAERVHAQRRFFGLEQRYLGGPSFGTLRALPNDVPPIDDERARTAPPSEPIASVPPVTATAALNAAPMPTEFAAVALVPAVAVASTTTATAAPQTADADSRTSQKDVAAMDARAVEPRASATRARAHSVRAASVGRSAEAAVPVKSSARKAFAVQLDEDPAPTKPARAPKRSTPEESTSSSGSSLDDAIRAAALRGGPKPKKPSNGSEYDPMNPEL